MMAVRLLFQCRRRLPRLHVAAEGLAGGPGPSPAGRLQRAPHLLRLGAGSARHQPGRPARIGSHHHTPDRQQRDTEGTVPHMTGKTKV